MDSLAIQRSLIVLEDRYRELREAGLKQFDAWNAEIGELKQQLAAQEETLELEKLARQGEAGRVGELESELAALKAERDGTAAGHATAEEYVVQQQQQLALQAESLEQLKAELAEKSAALVQAQVALSQVSRSLRQLVQR